MEAASLAEIELPEFDELDPALRGPAFDDRMAEVVPENWLAKAKLGFVVLDREARRRRSAERRCPR